MADRTRKSRRQYHSQLPPYVQAANDQPAPKQRRIYKGDAPPSAGRSWRTAAVNPPDQTPIMPPARRKPHADFMPASLGNRVRRGLPKQLQLPDPAVLHRRTASVSPFVPPGGRSRRGRPVLNEIGPSTPVERPRRLRASVIPVPGKVTRHKLPSPDPEPQVLPPVRQGASEGAMGVLCSWVRPRQRRLFLSAAPSPDSVEPCPYRPEEVDEQEAQARAAQDEQESPGRVTPDDGESGRTRVDECQ